MMTTTTRIGMSTETEFPFAEALAVVSEALKHEGFGVLTTIDVRATMKVKLDAEMPDYVILGACNPALAYAALKDDPDVGLLLPCNVTVRAQEGGGSVVSFMDPLVIAELSDAEGLAEVAALARQKLERVLAEVKGARR